MAGPHGSRAIRPWRLSGSGRGILRRKVVTLGSVAFVALPREKGGTPGRQSSPIEARNGNERADT